MKKVFLFAAVVLFGAGLLHAQDRFNNRQWSLNVGTMSVPEATFYNLNDGEIAVTDPGTMLPWAVGVRFEREKMASDLLGWGWAFGLGLRHTGWKATIPAFTPAVGNTGLTPDEDWALSIPMTGVSADGGLYASLHLTPTLEVYGGLGLAAILYWNMRGKAESASFTDEHASESVLEGLGSTLLGAYGQLGLKLTFNEDYFVSLSARYCYGLNEGGTNGLFDWEGAFYSTRVQAPFTSDLSVMLGIGIMIED